MENLKVVSQGDESKGSDGMGKRDSSAAFVELYESYNRITFLNQVIGQVSKDQEFYLSPDALAGLHDILSETAHNLFCAIGKANPSSL
jgi:hypothetical protein